VGWGCSHVGKYSVVALVFGFGMDSCQTSVILYHSIKLIRSVEKIQISLKSEKNNGHFTGRHIHVYNNPLNSS
jgi:hypothetical protein